FRIELLDRERNGVDLLHEFSADEARDAAAARTGDEDAERGIGNGEFFLDAFEEFQDLFRLLGLVALIILPENFVFRRIDYDRLHGRRSNVEADVELFVILVHRRLVSNRCLKSGYGSSVQYCARKQAAD